MFSNFPLTARNQDGVPRIISVGRLSQPKDTAEETAQSLESMRAQDEKLLDMHFPVPKHVDFLGEQSSGMIPDRDTMQELWRRIDANMCDLVVAEDISRIFRNPKLQWEFVQKCVDVGVRVICFADNLDTADDNWFFTLTVATVRHGLTIEDTRRRIKRKSTTAFEQGGEVGKTRFGYAKVSREDAAAGKYGPKGLRIRRLDEWNWVYLDIKRRFPEKEKPLEVVEWLNSAGIPPGPYVTSQRWTVKLLQQNLQCPLLHGTRQFRRERSVLVFGTGRFRREANAEPATQYVPELAHMTREEQEEMLAAVGWRIDWGGVKPPPAEPHPRKGISRYQSYWPAQSATCSVSGDKMYAVGKFLRCSNSFRRRAGTCWNHVLVPIAPLRAFIVAWLVKFARTSAAFRSVLLPVIQEQLRGQDQRRQSERSLKSMKVRELETQERNLRRSIKLSEELSDEELKSLVADLTAVTAQLKEARQDAQVDESAEPFFDLSDVAIMANLEQVLTHLVDTSFAMAALLRRFVPKCGIVPVQALDTGQVQPRAKLSVRGCMENCEQLDELVVDLFEPPVHIRLMPDAVRLRNQEPRPTLKQIGAALGTSYMTVKRALAYDRRMKDAGASEPFIELRDKPANASRWRHAPGTPADDAA